MTYLSDAEVARSQAAHAAAASGPPAPGTPENAALVTAAAQAARDARTQASAQAVSALTAASGVLAGLQSVLGAVAGGSTPPDANLTTAAAVLGSVGTAAGALTAALQGGTPLPFALADTALVTLLPDGSARTLALGVTGALAYAETSDDPTFSAGRSILASVAAFASDYVRSAASAPGGGAAGGPPTLATYAAGFVLPLLGYVAGGMQPGAAKYLPGALAQNALDLIFVSGLAARQEQP